MLYSAYLLRKTRHGLIVIICYSIAVGTLKTLLYNDAWGTLERCPRIYHLCPKAPSFKTPQQKPHSSKCVAFVLASGMNAFNPWFSMYLLMVCSFELDDCACYLYSHTSSAVLIAQAFCLLGVSLSTGKKSIPPKLLFFPKMPAQERDKSWISPNFIWTCVKLNPLGH